MEHYQGEMGEGGRGGGDWKQSQETNCAGLVVGEVTKNKSHRGRQGETILRTTERWGDGRMAGQGAKGKRNKDQFWGRGIGKMGRGMWKGGMGRLPGGTARVRGGGGGGKELGGGGGRELHPSPSSRETKGKEKVGLLNGHEVPL